MINELHWHWHWRWQGAKNYFAIESCRERASHSIKWSNGFDGWENVSTRTFSTLFHSRNYTSNLIVEEDYQILSHGISLHSIYFANLFFKNVRKFDSNDKKKSLRCLFEIDCWFSRVFGIPQEYSVRCLDDCLGRIKIIFEIFIFVAIVCHRRFGLPSHFRINKIILKTWCKYNLIFPSTTKRSDSHTQSEAKTKTRGWYWSRSK